MYSLKKINESSFRLVSREWRRVCKQSQWRSIEWGRAHLKEPECCSRLLRQLGYRCSWDESEFHSLTSHHLECGLWSPISMHASGLCRRSKVLIYLWAFCEISQQPTFLVGRNSCRKSWKDQSRFCMEHFRRARLQPQRTRGEGGCLRKPQRGLLGKGTHTLGCQPWIMSLWTPELCLSARPAAVYQPWAPYTLETNMQLPGYTPWSCLPVETTIAVAALQTMP